MYRLLAILVLFLNFYQVPVLAKATEIRSESGRVWIHQHTKAGFPAKIGKLERYKISDLTAQQLDVVVSYRDESNQSILTLYIYRASIDNIPLWFETAKHSLMNGKMGQMGAELVVDQTFVPPFRSTSAGMLASYSLAPSGNKSTAIAMVPAKGWILKARYTSYKHDPQSLAGEIKKIFSSIYFAGSLKQVPNAVAIKDCSKPLKLKSKIKRFPPSLVDAMIGGVTAIADEEEKREQDQPAKNITYCRDPGDHGRWTIFRANESRDSYILPLGDSGRAVSVFQNTLSGAISGDRRKRYTPVHMKLGINNIYSDIDALPTPDSLLAALDDRAIISSSTTWPEDGSTVTIDRGLVTDD